MGVQFHFCELYNNFPLDQKVSLNKSCVKKVIAAFEKEGINLKEYENILFFFSDNKRSLRYPDELGSLISKTSPEYKDFQNNYTDEIKKIKNFSSFEYVIYLSKRVGESDCEIFKILTISHECQHIIQDLKIRNIILKAIVLKKYLKLKCRFSNEVYRNLPSEYDAFRESKRISFIICSRENVENFLDKKIKCYKNRLIYTSPSSNGINNEASNLTYWEHIKAINIEELFDLDREFEKIWAIYEKDIKKEISRISRIQTNERKESEKDFLEAYKFLCQTKYIKIDGS